MRRDRHPSRRADIRELLRVAGTLAVYVALVAVVCILLTIYGPGDIP